MSSPFFKYAHLITVFWMAFVIAISFFETPLKFTAPLVTLKIGVSIGEVLFPKLNKLEWAFCLFLTLTYFLSSKKPPTLVWFVLLLLLIQSTYLLPALHERAQALLLDQPLQNSWHHHAYVIIEILKITSLFLLLINQFNYHENRYIKP